MMLCSCCQLAASTHCRASVGKERHVWIKSKSCFMRCSNLISLWSKHNLILFVFVVKIQPGTKVCYLLKGGFIWWRTLLKPHESLLLSCKFVPGIFVPRNLTPKLKTSSSVHAKQPNKVFYYGILTNLTGICCFVFLYLLDKHFM